MVPIYINWNPDPEIFHIGNFALRWYGVLFASGFIFGYFIIQWMFKKEKVPVRLLEQLTTYMVIATIIGARLGHCLLYEPEYYLQNPIEILKIWEGGLASHGAAVVIILALWLFARRFNMGYLYVLDRIAVVTALAGMFIRLGNLMNSEIYGEPTDLPWGFIFVRASNPVESTMPRHPSQIYEALSYLLIFLYLLYYYRKNNGKTRDGYLIGMFFTLVFTMRFLIEFIKEPQVAAESDLTLNYGQLYSIPLIILGIGLIIYSYRKKKVSPQN